MWILPLLKKRRIEPLDSESVRYQSKRDKIVNICWIIERAWEFQNNICFCFIDYASAFDCVDHKIWHILKETGIPDHLPTSWEICMQVKRQQLEVNMDQWTGSKLGKEYVKAIYCHPAYLTYMPRTSCKMLGWIKHKLESRLLGEISITQICRWYHSNDRKWRGTKVPLDDSERGEWKSWFKTQHSKKWRSWHLVPSLHGK